MLCYAMLCYAMKAAAIFFFSALSFCTDEHPEQCMSTLKLAATFTVIGGTLLYYAPPGS